MQATPFEPHAWSAVPGRHVPWSQHPFGQLAVVQTHVPFWHSVPAGHATQVVPFEPQNSLLLPP